MKILGHTRAFSFRKVTLGAVTALIGLGTIGAMGNQAQASTHSSYSQSHRTTTNGKSTSTQSRVKTTTVKPIVTSTKVVKPVHQTSKVQTTKKVVPTKQSTKSIKPVVTKAPTKQATSSKTSVTVSKAPTTSTGKTTTTKSVTTRPKSTSAVKSTSTKPTAKTSRTSSTSKKSTTTTKATKSTTTTKRTSSSTSGSKSGTTTSRTTTPSKSTATHTSTSTRTSSTKKSTTSTTKPSTTKSTSTSTKPSTSTKQPTTTPATTVPTTNQTDNNQEMIGTAPEGHIKDKYQSMTQLESETVEGVDWKKDTRDNGTKVLIVAPHGGNIEQGTTEATKALAKKGNYDYFSFEAIRPKNNTELHVTSTHYDDPTLNQMIQNRTATISIHGAAGTDQIIYLGGPPSTLRDEMETQLKSSGFTVMAPLDYIGGVKKNNFINREENNTGVQLELTTALRKAFFNNGDTSTKNRSNESNWTPLMQTFVDALYTSINNIYPNH
ncbi:poly-gamma-glutamate hydrolase family protein [Staphylococcus capitis]|uniref:poly-gamma-glutamate hydrolase family protein n=1 Tax=Staphylococcus capitis TaxID=29388 RepID=UPI00321BDB27